MVEQVDVKCCRCNESCYGEVISTYGKYYHQYCFSCAVGGCNQDLSQVGFFSVDGKLYCRDDYRKLLGIRCAGCSKYVEGDAVSAADSRFHPSCFGCIRCGKVFQAGADVCYDGEDFFCQSCNASTKAKKEVPAEAPKEKDSTKNDIDNARNEHVDSKSSSGKCAGCENYIKTGQALLALDKQWHLWCFTCYKCGALLTGEYMGRDGVPYCEKDYQAEFGITCAGCNNYITGKVLQAGEKHYHPSCSRCAKCGEMFGEGEDMYLQGSEIWHPHCSDEHVASDPEGSDISKSDYESESPSPIITPKKEFTRPFDAPLRAAPVREAMPANDQNTVPSRNLNLNPVPYGQSSGKFAGLRSFKAPGYHSVKPPESVSQPPTSTPQPQPPKSSGDETDDAPPRPAPPVRSVSSQWRQKYASMPRSTTPKSDQSDRPASRVESSGTPSPDENRQKYASMPRSTTPKSDQSDRPVSCIESSSADEKKGELKNTLSYSTNSLNSNGSGTFPRKGIGYNQLQQRILSQKDGKPVKLPTNIDPDRLRQFLNDPDHNVYLEDHEFYDLFKMTREQFYYLPQRKKEELKSGILLY